MNLFKKYFGRRKIEEQIEKLKLQNEKMKLRAAISQSKAKRTSAEMNNFIKTLDTAQEIKDIVGTKDNALLQILESESGKMALSALIQKFGGGEKGAYAIIEMAKKLSPDQKAELAAVFVGGKK